MTNTGRTRILVLGMLACIALVLLVASTTVFFVFLQQSQNSPLKPVALRNPTVEIASSPTVEVGSSLTVASSPTVTSRPTVASSPTVGRASGPTDGFGIYESCALHLGRKCLDRLKAMAAGGFKLVINYSQFAGSMEEQLAYAHQAQQVGIRIIWNFSDTRFTDGSDLTSTFPALAATCDCTDNTGFLQYVILHLTKDNPATWGYYVGDEIDPSNHDAVKQLADTIHQLDPFHPRLFVTGSATQAVNENLATFADTADVLAQDYYPVGRPHQTIAGTRRVAAGLQSLADRYGKQSAMVLQAYSLGEYPRFANFCTPFPTCMPYPSMSEMRQMRDLVLQYSTPRLILWYSFQDILRSDDPTLRWDNLVAACDCKQ